MRFYFLLLVIFIFSCNTKPQHEIKPDSVKGDSAKTVSSDSSGKNSDTTKRIGSKEFFRKKLPNKIFHGATFKFEIDSMRNDLYLEIFGKDPNHIGFLAQLFLIASDHHVNTGNYEEIYSTLGDYEINSDKLIFYEFGIKTRKFDDQTCRSTSKGVKETIQFMGDGTILKLKKEEGEAPTPVYLEVMKKLSKQIAQMKSGDPLYDGVIKKQLEQVRK